MRSPCKVSMYVFSWAPFFTRFQAQRSPPKRASKTSAMARERQQEKRPAAKSVKIDISDEDRQEVVDWLLHRRQESSGKNQCMSAEEYFFKRWEQKYPCKAERNTKHHPQPLATIHKHLGTLAIVVCSGPLHQIKSPESSERCRTVRAPCDNTLSEGYDCQRSHAQNIEYMVNACRVGLGFAPPPPP